MTGLSNAGHDHSAFRSADYIDRGRKGSSKAVAQCPG
jgi:hypothetical protein